MKQRIRNRTVLCACSYPVGIHGTRCRGCENMLCLACTRRALDVGVPLCIPCERQYDAETAARAEDEERGRMILLSRLEDSL